MSENSTAAPASVVLKELLEGKKASREQQMRVLEYRREIIVRCMKNFSQKTLGQLAFLDSGDGFCHELQKDEPHIVSLDYEFKLDSRGFFAGNSFCKKKQHKEYVSFGINNDSWLLIKTSYIPEERKGVYEKASCVQVERTELSTILWEVEIEPSHIWTFFKMITDDWVSDRKKLYDDACKVAQGMNEEDSIFRMIS